MTVTDAINKVATVTQAAFDSAVKETIDKYEALNKAQLYAGKDKEGKDLYPSYLDDPYFKTRQAAVNYSNWKDKITPNANRKSGVPNLFVNGKYYDSWTTRISGTRVEIESSDSNAKSIEGKFSNNVYGLDDDSMDKYREIVRPLIIAEVKAQFNA